MAGLRGSLPGDGGLLREGASDEADTGPRFIGEMINRLCEACFQGKSRAMVWPSAKRCRSCVRLAVHVLAGSQLWLNGGSGMSRRWTRSRYELEPKNDKGNCSSNASGIGIR